MNGLNSVRCLLFCQFAENSQGLILILCCQILKTDPGTLGGAKRGFERSERVLVFAGSVNFVKLEITDKFVARV